jgi:hypothetical protein
METPRERWYQEKYAAYLGFVPLLAVANLTFLTDFLLPVAPDVG